MALMNKDEVVRILEMVAESTLDEIEIQVGDLKLRAKKSAAGEAAQKMQSVPLSGPVESAQTPAEPAVRKKKAAPLAGPQRPAAHQKPATFEEEEGFTAIKSPMLGAFYRAPKPDAPPFVEVGQMVDEDDTVCIIEVMKLFNTIKAGVRGRIAKICVENAQMVEFQQPLFLVEEIAAEHKKEQPKR
jgi:acetyl-CoA carboxylase biotin carboxyl carrier protein